jgi:hypothetical protein
VCAFAPAPSFGHQALPSQLEGPPDTLPQPTRALGSKVQGTPEATAMWSRATLSVTRPGRDVALRAAGSPSPRGRHSCCLRFATASPTSLAPRPPSVTPTFAQRCRGSLTQLHTLHTRGPPAMCRASPIEVVTAPLAARFLLFLLSHLPPNPLHTPPSSPGRPIHRGRPPAPHRLSSRLGPCLPGPVRPQPWAGGWAAAAAAAAAAEAARSTIVFLTLCAPTLRLFPFLPPLTTPRRPPAPPTAGRTRSTRLAGSPPSARLPAERSSGGLSAVADATGFEAPPT